MGKHVALDSKITKTTKGLIVLPEDHPSVSYTHLVLSNPYGIATLFKLSPEDTKQVVPIAREMCIRDSNKGAIGTGIKKMKQRNNGITE